LRPESSLSSLLPREIERLANQFFAQSFQGNPAVPSSAAPTLLAGPAVNVAEPALASPVLSPVSGPAAGNNPTPLPPTHAGFPDAPAAQGFDSPQASGFGGGPSPGFAAPGFGGPSSPSFGGAPSPSSAGAPFSPSFAGAPSANAAGAPITTSPAAPRRGPRLASSWSSQRAPPSADRDAISG
jgi:hypothetical protein